jgi:hypothetical protein
MPEKLSEIKHGNNKGDPQHYWDNWQYMNESYRLDNSSVASMSVFCFFDFFMYKKYEISSNIFRDNEAPAIYLHMV